MRSISVVSQKEDWLRRSRRFSAPWLNLRGRTLNYRCQASWAAVDKAEPC